MCIVCGGIPIYYITCFTIHPAEEDPLETSENSLPSCSEAVDELFVTTFNSIRDTATDAISKICDFTGKLSTSFVQTLIKKKKNSYQLHLSQQASLCQNISI
jgi:hypothetical protein